MRADQHPYPRFPVAGPMGPPPPYGPRPQAPMPPFPRPGHLVPQPPMDHTVPEALRGPQAPERRRPKWRIKAGALTAVVAIGAVAWVGLGGNADAGTTQVQLESVSSAGAMPFTAPVGNDVANVASPENAAGPQAGNTGGLYAQDPAAPACDTQALIAQLTADPAKAAAWGRPLNVEANGIDAFVTSLSSVTLRADTAVTEYGYAEGAFQPYPAVLQAGTAVMVNSYGEPTVKCQNGNPLGAATSSNDTGTVVGTTWVGFTAERTIRVTPAPAPQQTLTVVNTTTNTTTPAPVKTQPGPNTPNPAPATNPQGQLALTMTRMYDGNVRLSDGRIMDKNGKVIDPEVKVEHPPNSQTFPDGSVQHPDGKRFNVNGTERLPLRSNIPGFGDVIINPNGSISPTAPNQFIPSGRVVQWNYDGTFTIFKPGSTLPVQTIGRDGKVLKSVDVPAGSKVQQDGSIVDGATGTTLNPDGSQRTSTTIDGVGTLGVDGGLTPAPQAAAKGNVNALVENKDPQNGGVDTKTLAARGVTVKPDGTVDTTTLPKDAVVDAKGNITLPDGTVLNPDGSLRTPDTGPTDGTGQKPAVAEDGKGAPICNGFDIDPRCTTTGGGVTQPEVQQAPAATTDGTTTGTTTGGSDTTGSTSTGSTEGSASGGSASTGSSSGSSSSESSSSTGGETQGN